jgi:hypothetical protein
MRKAEAHVFLCWEKSTMLSTLLLLLLLPPLYLQSGLIADLMHGLDRHDFPSNPRMSESKRQLPAPFQGILTGLHLTLHYL